MADRSPAPLRFAVSRTHGGPALLDGARQLAAALGRELAAPVELVVRYDYAALEKAVASSTIELAWMPPLLHARAVQKGARLIALSQRGGRLGYRSALVMRRGRFASVRELSGVRAAWVDRSSASGYLFPRLHLVAAGVDPAKAFASERFCGSATNAVRLVVDGEADLAACFLSVAGDRAAAEREIAGLFKTGDTLGVLDVTAQSPPDGFVVARTVDDARAHAVRNALFALHARPDGRVALTTLLQAERLAPVPAELVRELQRLVAFADQ